jgi:hypothetical protein
MTTLDSMTTNIPFGAAVTAFGLLSLISVVRERGTSLARRIGPP